MIAAFYGIIKRHGAALETGAAGNECVFSQTWNRSKNKSLFVFCTVTAAVMAAGAAAQPVQGRPDPQNTPSSQATSAVGDGIVDQLKLAVDTMGDRLAGIVIGILVTLLVVDIVLTFGRAVISDSNLGDVVGPFILRFAFVGLAWFFAQNAADMVQFLIETTLRIGQQARGTEAHCQPSNKSND